MLLNETCWNSRLYSYSWYPATNSENTNLNGIMKNMAILVAGFQVWELLCFRKFYYINFIQSKLNWVCYKILPNLLFFQVIQWFHFKRHKIFHWACSYFAKNLSNFVIPCLKIHNRYYHNEKPFTRRPLKFIVFQMKYQFNSLELNVLQLWSYFNLAVDEPMYLSGQFIIPIFNSFVGIMYVRQITWKICSELCSFR